MRKWCLEMSRGQDLRVIEADGYTMDGGWLVFHQNPATGGRKECFRVRMDYVVAIGPQG